MATLLSIDAGTTSIQNSQDLAETEVISDEFDYVFMKTTVKSFAQAATYTDNEELTNSSAKIWKFWFFCSHMYEITVPYLYIFYSE